MLKKAFAVSFFIASNMSFAAQPTTKAAPKRSAKVRMVTMSDREVALVQKAAEIAAAHGVEAPLVAQHAPRLAQGKREIERSERNALINEACEQLQLESKRLI